MQSGSGQDAAAFVSATIVRLAGEVGGLEELVIHDDLNIDILPEVRGAQGVAGGGIRSRTGRSGDEGAVSGRQLDLNGDGDELFLAAMFPRGLKSSSPSPFRSS